MKTKRSNAYITLRNERGTGFMEWMVLAAMICVVCIVVVAGVGKETSSLFQEPTLTDALNGN